MPLAAIVVLVAGFAIASSMRWRRAVRVMEGEPGYLVVDASRSWRRWEFRGLRDPLAREPRTVLASAGLPSHTIACQWKPYISLDSAIVVARARRAVAAPPTTTIALVGDTLRLGGSASIDWLNLIRGAAPIAGVGRLDLSSVRATTPVAIEEARRRIDSSRVLFAPASAAVSAAEAARIGSLATTLRQLLDSVTTLGGSVRVGLVGRTDATGSDATNQSLAQLRVDAVARRLGALGVPAAMLQARPVATAEPLRGRNADEQSRINRSVSFEVLLTIGSRGPRGS
jgi:OOP family OmpA-OmpF porin